jgi:hypothetical protein
MNLMPDRPSRRPLPATLLALAFALFTTGCAGPTTQLTVRSLDRRQTYQQRFDSAYAGRSEQGDYDVVLVKGGGSVREVMHVRVLWKPMKGTKLDHPSATNAVIDWIVWDGSQGPDGGGAFIAYTGAGFVDLSRSGDTAKLDIRNATLSPTSRHGSMNDPLGRTKLTGTVVARTNRDQVDALLSQVQSTVAAAQPTTPPRQPPTGSPSASSRAPLE